MRAARVRRAQPHATAGRTALFHDPEALLVASGLEPPYVDRYRPV